VKILTSIYNRIYHDYLMISRLSEYEKIIKHLTEEGYQHITMKEFCYKLKNSALDNKKYFINRHDIDTDISTAKEFFKIEKKYNAKATYYFRLSTLDIDLMKEISDYGSEVGYHFEEIATFAKKNHIKSKDKLLENLEEIKSLFKINFRNIEKKANLKIETVCSHGDFVNRKLNILNNEITKDKSLREELGIKCEAYDKDLMKGFDIYLSDGGFSLCVKAKDILLMMKKRNIICLLTHPRQWRTNWKVNTLDNIKRMWEEFKW
jgi:hypothetical protein